MTAAAAAEVPATLRAVEVERAVIWSCLDDAHPASAAVAARFLRPDDFTDPFCREAFAITQAVITRGDRMCSALLVAELEARNSSWTKADTAPWLGELGRISAVGTRGVRIEQHLRVLRERTMLRALRDVGARMVRATEAGVADVGDFALRARSAVAGTLRALDPNPDHMTWTEQVDAELARLSPDAQRALPPVPSGFAAIDDARGGWSRGNRITIIGGFEGSGKSAFVVSSLLRTAAAGHRCVYVTLEEPRSKVIHRMLSNLSGVENRLFDTPAAMTDEQHVAYRRAARVLRDLPLHVVASRSTAAAEDIRRESEAIRDEFGAPAVVAVDNASRLKARGRRPEKRHEELATELTDLNALAKDHECAVLVLSHVGRAAGEGAHRALTRRDLLYGGEREAGSVILLNRDPKDTAPDGSGAVRFDFDKVNEASTGFMWLRFVAPYVRFEE